LGGAAARNNAGSRFVASGHINDIKIEDGFLNKGVSEMFMTQLTNEEILIESIV
jgi:hypothetical protein